MTVDAVKYTMSPSNGTNFIRSGIEVVITALTRNQVYRQRYRGFESHPLRQKKAAVKAAFFNEVCLAAREVHLRCVKLASLVKRLRA